MSSFMGGGVRHFQEEYESTIILSEVFWMLVLPSSVAVAEAIPVVKAGR